MPASHDATLLLAMSRGDQAAANDLHARINPRLAAYTRALLRNDASADDVIQQTWLRVLSRSPDELARIDDALAWLIRIARFIALNHLRSQSRAAKHAHRAALNGVHTSNGAKPPAAHDHSDLHTAIDALPEDHREIILLKHIANLTFDQIAETLGENRNTIASRYRAAIDTLRRHLNPSQREALHA